MEVRLPFYFSISRFIPTSVPMREIVLPRKGSSLMTYNYAFPSSPLQRLGIRHAKNPPILDRSRIGAGIAKHRPRPLSGLSTFYPLVR